MFGAQIRRVPLAMRLGALVKNGSPAAVTASCGGVYLAAVLLILSIGQLFH